MSATAEIRKSGTPLMPVIYGERCVGFVLRRFDGFAAFNIDEHPCGVFASERDAVAALFTRPGGTS